MADAAREVRLVTLTEEQLEAAVARGVARALATSAPAANDGERYVDIDEAARIVGKSKRTITNWKNAGLPFEWAGNELRFKVSALREFARAPRRSMK